MKLPDLSIDQVLSEWDRGGRLWSVEMGGLGPSYEQCIQILAFEILREFRDATADTRNAARDRAVARLDDAFHFSTAQVSAATNLANVIQKRGYRAALESVEPERLIQVTRDFPRMPTREVQS